MQLALGDPQQAMIAVNKAVALAPLSAATWAEHSRWILTMIVLLPIVLLTDGPLYYVGLLGAGVLLSRNSRHALPFVMRGRPMDGWLRIDPEGLRTKRQLERWVSVGVTYVRSLPPKPGPRTRRV